jgi:hypothetical protein
VSVSNAEGDARGLDFNCNPVSKEVDTLTIQAPSQHFADEQNATLGELIVPIYFPHTHGLTRGFFMLHLVPCLRPFS